MSPELSGQKALENVAYVYRGGRSTAGPWFNQVETWIMSQLDAIGFTAGENSSNDCYWIQQDTQGAIWVPQYLSFQIVGPEGDANPIDPAAYHFDHPAISTFDPTSPYYPAYMTQQWVIDNQRTPAEEAINDRDHLATSSNFTAPMNTDLAVAETPAGGAIIADVVDVGTVSGSGSSTRTWSKHSTTSLAGKILFSATSSISNLMTLASQQSAKAVMSPAALASYNHPTINGVEVYSNNVKYAGGGSAAAPTRITLNISYDDSRFLTALCAQYDLTSSFPPMKLFAVGSSLPSGSGTLRTLIAEMKGTTKADERIMEMGHVQENGAEDNASGVGQQLEMLRATKHLIDTGALPRPRRTMTYMWGNEMTMSRLYKASHPAEYNKIVAAFSNDMVGADQATTGAVYVLDKMPDPSARYKYQTDVLAGTTPPTPTQFLRSPDTHTLWGAGSLSWYPYAGHFLTDLYFASGKIMEVDSPTFDTRYRLKPSPWEGGSDAQPFLWNTDVVGGVTVRHPISALATFFFTDYTYHSSMDTMKAVSAQRLQDVGIMSQVFAYYRADADVKSAGETLDIVKAAADQRFGWEQDNSTTHFLWALLHPYGTPATIDEALHEAFTGTGNTSSRSIGETQLLTEWGVWYREAVTSARTMFDPADNTPAYDAHETESLAAVAADATEAQDNAAHLFAAFHFSGAAIAINGGAEWTTTRDVTLTLAASSVAPGGVTGMRFSDDGVTWPAIFQAYATSAPYTLPAGDGAKTVYAQFQDSEGNISDAVSASIKLDATGPTASIGGVPAGWVNRSVPLSFSAVDGSGSGVDFIEYKLGAGVWSKGTAVTISAEGATIVACRATDKLGNVGPETAATIDIDLSAPSLSDDAPADWMNHAVTVTLVAQDTLSGVATLEYKLDKGRWQSGSSVLVKAPRDGGNDGVHTIAYRAADNAGNVSESGCTVRIDTQGPCVTASVVGLVKRGATATFRYKVTDKYSPTATVTIKVRDLRGRTVATWLPGSVATAVTQTYQAEITLDRGVYTVEFEALDLAGNKQSLPRLAALIVR